MSKLKIITGGIGSGKERACIEDIKAFHGKYSDSKCIMLVNEHYSYEMEKSFIDAFFGTGLNNIEVKTFRKLAIDTLNEGKVRYMTLAGKQTLMSRAVSEFMSLTKPENRKMPDDDENIIYINEKLYSSIGKQGFLDVLMTITGEMKRYEITPEELYNMSKNIKDNEALSQKLMVISNIYAIYTRLFLGTGYVDADDTYDELAVAIENGNDFDNVYLWIDKFDELLPQQMRVIRALYKKVKKMTVSLCYPETVEEQNHYEQIKRTLEKIKELDYDFESFDCGRHLKHIKKEDLFFLIDKFNSYEKYDDEVKSISLLESGDTYNEVKFCADEILRLVFDEDYRFRDICVVCGNEDKYMSFIETVFDEYDIPYFADRSMVLSEHPAASQILSLFEMFENRFDYASVFKYLRSGYVYIKNDFGLLNVQKLNISGADMDELENHVIKYGIRGEKKWTDTVWEGEKSFIDAALENELKETNIEGIEALRETLMKPVKTYRRKTGGKKSAAVHAKALFEFLEDIYMYEGINSDIAYLCKNPDDEKNINEARTLEKIWNLLMQMLEQIVGALGEEGITRSEFYKYVDIAMRQCEIRMIPSGIDRVYIGAAERNSSVEIRAMFMLGASDGTYPEEIKTEGFLSDTDRNEINNTFTKNVAPDTRDNMEKRRYSVWSAIAKVYEKLYISYPASDSDGHEQTPSQLFMRVREKFPKISVLTDSDLPTRISTPKAALHDMLVNKSEANSNNDMLWNVVYDCLSNEKYGLSMLTDLWKDAKSYTNISDRISPKLSRLIYGDEVKYSASRLNVYAGCPFKYFMNYGLGVKEREMFEIAASDIGTYAHSVIEQFCASVEEGAKDREEKLRCWKALADADRDIKIDQIIDKTIENINSDEIYKREHIKSIFNRTGKVIKRAAKNVHNSLRYGRYTIAAEENELSLKLNSEVSVRGRVDRIDECDENRIRIIDYKTGNTEFDINHIYSGIDMQLIIYAIMAKEYFKEQRGEDCDVSGMYYNFVKPSGIKRDMGQTDTEIKDKLRKSVLLDGVTFIRDINTLDDLKSIDEGIEDNSNVIKVNYTTSGKISMKQNLHIREQEDSKAIMEFVGDKILSFDDEIRNQGNIKISPACDSKYNACDYCAYSDICALDGEIEQRPLERERQKDKVWNKIKGEE